MKLKLKRTNRWAYFEAKRVSNNDKLIVRRYNREFFGFYRKYTEAFVFKSVDEMVTHFRYMYDKHEIDGFDISFDFACIHG